MSREGVIKSWAEKVEGFERAGGFIEGARTELRLRIYRENIFGSCGGVTEYGYCLLHGVM